MLKQDTRWLKKVLGLITLCVSLILALYPQETRRILEISIQKILEISRIFIIKITLLVGIQEFWWAAGKIVFGALIILTIYQWPKFALENFLWLLKKYLNPKSSNKALKDLIILAINFVGIIIIGFMLFITGKCVLNNSIDIYSFSTSPVAIESGIGAEWRVLKLKQHLGHGNWFDADNETTKLVHWATQDLNNNVEYLSAADLRKLPCEDLQTINQLWLYYSNRKFGYSVQENILKEVGGDLFQFGEKVGWLKDGAWVFQNDYDLKAPKGHLPAPLNVGVVLQRTVPEQSLNPQLRRTLPEQPSTQLQRTLPEQPSNTLTRTEPLAPSFKSYPVPLTRRTSPSKVPLARVISIPRSCEDSQ